MGEDLSGWNLKVGFRMIEQYLLPLMRFGKRVMVMQIKRELKELSKMEKEKRQEFLRNQRHLRSLTQLRRQTCLGRGEKETSGTQWSGIELQRNSHGRDFLA